MNNTVKGFRDYTGEEALRREKAKEIIVKNFKLFGFEPAETPIIEYEDFVRGENTEDEAVSDIFKLKDKGKRNLALRYEFTFQLKRISQNKKLPYRRYQIGNVFRDEPVTSNRLREFLQCDADIIGATIKDDAEILALASKILNELCIDAVIYVNNKKLLNEILEKEGIIKDKRDAVIREIDKLDKLSEEDVRRNLLQFGAEPLIDIFKKNEKFFEKYEYYKEIKELKEYCRMFGVEVKFNPSLARGLSYYTGTIFEVKTKKMKETICAGGSYMVNGTQATGISFGRAVNLYSGPVDRVKCLIISINKDKEAIRLAQELRKTGISCSIAYGKISKSLEYADHYKIEKVIFVGKEEIEKRKFKVRDMSSGKEIYFSLEELKNFF